jgi:SpoVK/Ycf46/Vps4 family AAA+-type ATPase
LASSDLVLKLVKAGVEGDKVLLHKTVEALVAEESAKQHHVLADRLLDTLKNSSKTTTITSTRNPDRRINNFAEELLLEIIPKRKLSTLMLPETVLTECLELIEEQRRADLLRSYGVEPRNRSLFVGPPGNGKTSLAESIAEMLMVPLYVVRYEALIGSFLGETASRLSGIFDFARTKHCVLFFDEFDTLGKERGDTHETGEIKRVVSSLLMLIDRLPSHVVVIAATNHAELLDRAVWRRFQVKCELPNPSKNIIKTWITNFESQIKEPLFKDKEILSDKLSGFNFSDIEEYCLNELRRYILRSPSKARKTNNSPKNIDENWVQTHYLFDPPH